MYLSFEKRVRDALTECIRQKYGVEATPVLERPPKIELGEIASPVCFELAKKLKRAPRQLAQEMVRELRPVEGVSRFEVAGGGYVNAFLDRTAFVTQAFREGPGRAAPVWADRSKAIIEHTAINPNKAAHIGHLRNAVIGDTFARLLRHSGREVEVQNYIDNTGVQVADVILGFLHLERKSLAEVQVLAARPRFDYYCWDLYARVTQFLEEDKSRGELRGRTMQEIEEGHGEVAEMADFVSTEILRAHLRTMDRLGIDYDLLSRESEILHMKFWEAAFQMLRERGAIRLAASGKQAGCWIMPLGGSATEKETAAEAIPEAEAKIIVRSNGTVTYVGKDIAYHLWKFGLLEKDFLYRRFHRHPDGHVAWATAAEGEQGAPPFGQGQEVYNVIDTRQKYPQEVVKEGLRALGFEPQADKLVHLAYDVVGLTPRCAKELGYAVSEEDAQRPYIEMSGRRGQGVKADDLLDQLEQRAREEVDARHRDFSDPERSETAHKIAMGALRYFLLKYTRSAPIAFDFKDALSFEGETGPYVQYAVVRSRSIWRKLAETEPGWGSTAAGAAKLLEGWEAHGVMPLLAAPEGNGLWELILLASSLDREIEVAIAAREPAFVAKYAFQLAQKFNLFYHQHHILSEADAKKKAFLLLLTWLVENQLLAALRLLGIEAPEKM